jgi:hypothetical protein
VTEGNLNADFSEAVVVHTSAIDWQPSPSPRVWRKRLDMSGPAERGRVTSIVRYDANSKFHAHPHPDGEEILVLDGVFSDGQGDFPAGCYLLNPEGFEHAPFSKEGCVLFVKLKQYPGQTRSQVALNMLQNPWDDLGLGVSQLVLYDEVEHPERMVMMRLEEGATLSVPAATGGAEMFLLFGTLSESSDCFRADRFFTGDWLRWPTQSVCTFTAIEPVTAYLKTGHLPL